MVPPPNHDEAAPGSYPEWVLLETVGLSANNCRKSSSSAETVASEATSAKTLARSVEPNYLFEVVETEVEVSFRLVSPPDVSSFAVRVGDDDVTAAARVISAEGDTVLLDFPFERYCPPDLWWYKKPSELPFHRESYFVYRAGHGSPSLELLPRPPPGKFHTRMVGVLPRGDGDGGYVVAAICPKCINGVLNYELFLYSSKTKAWSAKVIPLECGREADLSCVWNHRITKVMAIGADSLGWVDLWRRIVVCNVLDEEDPKVRFIQLPGPPMPRNAGDDPRFLRDVICIGDLIKFVELEHHNANGVSTCSKSVDSGWKATSWSRKLPSMDWQEGFTVDTDGIPVTDGVHSQLIRGDKAERLSLNKLVCSAPTLSMDDDVFYMMVTLSRSPMNLALASVNMRESSLELAPFNAGKVPWFPCPCTFSSRCSA